MDEITSRISKLISLNEEEWKILQTGLKKVSYDKGDLILSEGEHCDFIAFIDSGIYRYYHIKNGIEKVTAFWFEGDVLSNYKSYLTDTPSTHFIEAMKPGIVWKIKRDYIKKHYKGSEKFNELGRIITENIFLSTALRLDNFIQNSPQERYLELYNRNPSILEVCPHYMIASYLGITPESLSRIRKRV